ncbi:MAG: glycosyltransferase family 39 protein [Candidatus Korobacteraceae bacterium]
MSNLTDKGDEDLLCSPGVLRPTDGKRRISQLWSAVSKLNGRYSSLGVLIILWLTAALIWYRVCWPLKTPRIFTDELSYWDLARIFHKGSRLPYCFIPDIPTYLFPAVLSPVFAFHDLVHSYQAARLMTAFLATAAVFPAYFLARELAERRCALAAAVLTVATPGLLYSSSLMTENLFYPLFLAAFWATYRVLRSGGLVDSTVAAIALSAAYYTKPHALVLIVAYGICTLLWCCGSLRSRPFRDIWQGFGVRLIPILGFALAVAPRIFLYPPHDRSFTAVLFGSGYSAVLLTHRALHFHEFWTAWSGLLLATMLGTAFVPFGVFAFSTVLFRRMGPARMWFWIFASLVWLGFTGLAARHTVLNDEAIRTHERYIYMTFPLMFTWYFVVRDQLSRRFVIAASGAALVSAAAIMRWPGHIFLTPAVNLDSPSLTGFIWLVWRHQWGFVALAILVAFLGMVAALFSLSRNIFVQVVGWSLVLAPLSIGWIKFEKRWINPGMVKTQELAQTVSDQVGRQATLGILLDDVDHVTTWQCDFWTYKPIMLYGTKPSVFAFRPLTVSAQGNVDFGIPAPDYLLAGSQLPWSLPLVAHFPLASATKGGTIYIYRVTTRK